MFYFALESGVVSHPSLALAEVRLPLLCVFSEYAGVVAWQQTCGVSRWTPTQISTAGGEGGFSSLPHHGPHLNWGEVPTTIVPHWKEKHALGNLEFPFQGRNSHDSNLTQTATMVGARIKASTFYCSPDPHDCPLLF